jgi:hypothetical protein
MFGVFIYIPMYQGVLKKFHNPTDTDMYKAAWHTYIEEEQRAQLKFWSDGM